MFNFNALAFWIFLALVGYFFNHTLDGALFGLMIGIGMSFFLTFISNVFR